MANDFQGYTSWVTETSEPLSCLFASQRFWEEGGNSKRNSKSYQGFLVFGLCFDAIPSKYVSVVAWAPLFDVSNLSIAGQV